MVSHRTVDSYSRVIHKKKKALNYALDIRKFEIELYWKRATYFWTLLVASFAAYFALKENSQQSSYQILIACIGFLISVGWYLVNRGSKYWQENWERHVDVLESEVIGSLYKTINSRDEYNLFNPLDAFPYSVSKINQIISLYILLVWLGIMVHALFGSLWGECIKLIWPWVLLTMTIIFVVILLVFGIGNSDKKARVMNFVEVPLFEDAEVYAKDTEK